MRTPIKKYIAIRGGIENLSEDEKVAILEMAGLSGGRQKNLAVRFIAYGKGDKTKAAKVAREYAKAAKQAKGKADLVKDILAVADFFGGQQSVQKNP